MEVGADYGFIWFFLFVTVAFVAGYIDAIAGGGGMIQVPILLIGGIPPVAALATNKVISMTGTFVVVVKYALHRLVIWRWVGLAAIPCAIASMAGSQLAMLTPAWVLEIAIFTCIFIAVIISLGVKPPSDAGVFNPLMQNKQHYLGWFTAIGLYDGFAGPGTGTFMVLTNNKVLGCNLVQSAAIAKPLNLMTNFGALIIFISAGEVVWSVAIPMLIANSLGGWIGGHYAIRNGSKFVWRVLVSVLIVMFTFNIGKMMI